MIVKANPYGEVALSNDYFSGLVAEAAKHCYGVAAMSYASASSTVRAALKNGSIPEKGVTVEELDGQLSIELHILVGYGLNIASITQSITHRVRDEVQQATGLSVSRVNVYVDDIISG